MLRSWHQMSLYQLCSPRSHLQLVTGLLKLLQDVCHAGQLKMHSCDGIEPCLAGREQLLVISGQFALEVQLQAISSLGDQGNGVDILKLQT